MRPSLSLPVLRKAALAFALLVGAAPFAASVPARAGFFDNGAGGPDHNDHGADHDEVYQVQRGDLVCHSREACGGEAAIPMNRPGWYYLPRTAYVPQGFPPAVPAHLHHRHHRRY